MALASGVVLPRVISRAGERAAERLIEFFTAHIRNRHTRRAYGRVAWNFFAWIEDRNITLEGITAVHVAAWVESLKHDDYEVASVKQHLAAVRMLLDYLVTGGVSHVSRHRHHGLSRQWRDAGTRSAHGKPCLDADDAAL